MQWQHSACSQHCFTAAFTITVAGIFDRSLNPYEAVPFTIDKSEDSFVPERKNGSMGKIRKVVLCLEISRIDSRVIEFIWDLNLW